MKTCPECGNYMVDKEAHYWICDKHKGKRIGFGRYSKPNRSLQKITHAIPGCQGFVQPIGKQMIELQKQEK